MKKLLILSLLSIFLLSFATAIEFEARTGNANSLYNYTFNFTTNADCSGVLLSYSDDILTDSNGNYFFSIDTSSISSIPYYLCEYKNSALRKTHNFSDIIFRSIRTQNITSEKIFSDDIHSIDWTNVTITESQISDLVHFVNSDETDQIWIADKPNYNTTLQLQNIFLNLSGGNANQDINIGIYDFYADDGFFDYLNFSYLVSNFGGTIDATGDPWYLSGTDLQIAENLIVNKNITATDVNATNIFVDHIAEKTAGHNIVIDNDVDLGANKLNFNNGVEFGNLIADQAVFKGDGGVLLIDIGSGRNLQWKDQILSSPAGFGVVDLGSVTVPWNTTYTNTLDLGTNTITDGSMTGNWDYGSGNLSAYSLNLSDWTNVSISHLTTDDLTQGSTNFYDNRSWNESRADGLYCNEGDNCAIDWTSASVGTIDATNIQDKFLRNDGDDTTSGTLTAGGYITAGTVQAEQINSTDDITMQGHLLTLGDDSATDVVIDFKGSANDGSIIYDESADEFDFGSSDISTTGSGWFNDGLGINTPSASDAGLKISGTMTKSESYSALYASPLVDMTTDGQSLYGFYSSVNPKGTHDITNVIGTMGGVWLVHIPPYTTYTGTIDKAIGVRADVSGNGAISVNTGIGVYIKNVKYGTAKWGIYDESGEDWGLDADNQKIFLGEGQNASIYYDATNLRLKANEVGDGIVYVDTNLSAENLIDRSWYWDKSLGNSLDFIKDTDELKIDGKHDDTKLNDFEKAVYSVTDFSKFETRKICANVSFPNEKGQEQEIEECWDETYYPYKKNETGRLVSATVGKHEQNLYDLNQKIEKTKEEACRKDFSSFIACWLS